MKNFSIELAEEFKRVKNSLEFGGFLSPDEERQLFNAYKMGDRAAGDKIITAHMPMVINCVSKRAVGRSSHMDMVQNGYEGLCMALSRFDMDKGFRFSTYALFWVRSKINSESLKEDYIVHAATTATKKAMLMGLSKVEAKIRSENFSIKGRALDEKIAAHYGVSLGAVSEIRELKKGAVSLNAPLSDENDSNERQDFLVSDLPNAEDCLLEEDEVRHNRLLLKQAFSRAGLSEREQVILRERRLSEEVLTLEDLATQFGVSRERIRQIEVRAFEKLQTTMLAMVGKSNGSRDRQGDARPLVRT